MPTATRRLPNRELPFWLCCHEAGHAVARIALDQGLPCSGPFIRRVVVQRREDWSGPYEALRGHAREGICGIVEMDARAMFGGIILKSGAAIPTEMREATVRDMWLDAVESLAGPTAEVQARRMSDLAAWMMLNGSEDFGRARQKLEESGRTLADLEVAWREAWALTKRQRPAVLALAGALQERQEIDGEEVEAIVAPLLRPLEEAA